jgi:hypothetical protein
MKIETNPKHIIEQVEKLSERELKIYSATFLRILEHLDFHSQGEVNEARKREQLRLMVAKKNINFWKNTFLNLIN